MSRGLKLLLGAATLWPLAYAGIFIGWWGSMMLGMASGSRMPPPFADPHGMGLFFALHCFTMAWTVALLVFYVSDLFRNPRVPADVRTLWAVVLFFGNIIAMPVYWSRYIWGEPDAAPPAAPS